MRLLLLLFPFALYAQMLQVGDRLDEAVLSDQFEKMHTIKDQMRIVVSWDKATTRLANLYFAEHAQLLDKSTSLIVDVSQTPSGIMSLFVMPRMRSYSHPILLSYDEGYNRKLPYKEAAVTVLQLEKGKVLSIRFAEDETALDAALKETF